MALLRPLILLMLLLAAAILAGALLAYPAWLLLGMFAEVEFKHVLSGITIIVGVFFSAIYLAVSGQFSWQALGLGVQAWGAPRQTLLYFLAGCGIVLGLELMLFTLGLHDWETRKDMAATAILSVALSGLLVGVLVSLAEETIFRGGLYAGLQQRINVRTAVLVTSLLYGLVHYIKYPAATQVTVWTGLQSLPEALTRWFRPAMADSCLTLVMLGILLGLIRWRSGHIVYCIALHAGVVMSIKVANYATNYAPGSGYDYLVNPYGHLLGLLAAGWLTLLTVVYALFSRRTVPKDK